MFINYICKNQINNKFINLYGAPSGEIKTFVEGKCQRQRQHQHLKVRKRHLRRQMSAPASKGLIVFIIFKFKKNIKILINNQRNEQNYI